MAKNTGRGTRLGAGLDIREWPDEAVTLPLVVWSEPEGVAIYEGEKEQARRRRLFTPDEAREMARLLIVAADNL
jgi:hypothetical protein